MFTGVTGVISRARDRDEGVGPEETMCPYHEGWVGRLGTKKEIEPLTQDVDWSVVGFLDRRSRRVRTGRREWWSHSEGVWSEVETTYSRRRGTSVGTRPSRLGGPTSRQRSGEGEMTSGAGPSMFGDPAGMEGPRRPRDGRGP